LSEIVEIDEPSRFQTKKRLDKPAGLLSWHHTRPLRTLKDILSEQSRVYRAMINGVISTAEGTRLVFVLKEIRCTREAIDAAEAAAAAVAAAAEAAAASTAQAQAKANAAPMAINIVAIPEGFYQQVDGSFAPMSPSMPQLEHTPEPEKLQLDEQEPEPEPVQMHVAPPPGRDDDDDHGVIYMRPPRRTQRPPRRPSWEI
jgi:hypothetical protein